MSEPKIIRFDTSDEDRDELRFSRSTRPAAARPVALQVSEVKPEAAPTPALSSESQQAATNNASSSSKAK